jgi:GNAT superfamily N-acetyltransferase
VAGDDATIDPVVVPEPALPVEPTAADAGGVGGVGGFVPPVVRRATAADVDGMAAQLAKTFWDDPVTSHIFRRGGERRRHAGLRAYFATQMRADYLPFGGCYTTDDYAGSAIWAPAGKPLLTGPGAVLTMVPVLPYVFDRLPTTLRILNKMESLHPHEPHWYLASLGTAVDLQGKGVGSALMQPVLSHCDAAGLPCYLESSKERNVPFYRRHGFEVVHEVPLPDNGPSIWTMWRDPQPKA